MSHNCPCCSDRLLRHVRRGSLYWFCRSCWAEMPIIEGQARPLVEPAIQPAVLEPTTLEPAVLQPTVLQPLVRSARDAELQTTSHFTKVIQYHRPQKTHNHLLVS